MNADIVNGNVNEPKGIPQSEQQKENLVVPIKTQIRMEQSQPTLYRPMNQSEESEEQSRKKLPHHNNRNDANHFYDESEHDNDSSAEYQPASCFQQTMALVWKNYLNKIRTPLGTFLELLSPAIFMLILVLGYSLSEEEYVSEASYAKWTFDFPNEVLTSSLLSFLGASLGNANSFDGIGTSASSQSQTRRSLLETTLSKLDYLFDYNDMDFEESDDSIIDNLDKRQWHKVHQLSRMLQNNATTEEGSDDDIVDGGYVEIVNSYNDLRRELRRILRSPMPIPTLSQFLTLSQSLSSAFDPNDLDLVYQASDYIRRWGNLLTLGTMHLSPKGKITEDFLNYFEENLNIVNISSSEVLEDRPNATSVLIRLHDNFDDATNYVLDNLDERTFVHIHFDEDDNNLSYTIRMNSTTLPNTNLITRWVQIGLNTEYELYYFSGHLSVQKTVNEFAIWRLNNNNNQSLGQCSVPDVNSWDVYTLPMPTPAYSQNPFFIQVGFLLGLVIAMSFLYPVSRLIKAMVEEKETRMKETLSILGVRPIAQWLSWLITSSVSSLIITIFVTLSLSRVMVYSSIFYIFIYILLFAFSTVGFAFFVSAFFSRANLAAIVGPVGLFVTLLPRWIFFGTNRYENVQSKMWASLLPCTAFAFGADILSDFEYGQVGIQQSNVQDGAYSFRTTLAFLLFDTILYLFLGWYFEQVIPRQYGVAKKWYFLLTLDFWIDLLPFTKPSTAMHIDTTDIECDPEDDTIEEVLGDAKVKISNLVKIYNPKKPPAINHLNLSLYESEITCLLGHNGAGKSSTISILTGLYPPTSGDVVIYNKSIRRDLVKCRQSMGVCPQQNVLFNNLTVLEHLRFFERIKGVEKDSVEDRALEVGLGDFFTTKASQLSGGNKRKLQLAIALAGDPKMVLLDEPTSGMDPYSRRATWEMLRKKRRGRIILLTTHFMDEAEVLADRVAILKEGSLQCCGSVLFLKDRFGLGYNITIMVEKEIDESTFSMTEIRNKITELMENAVQGTKFIRESARELVYRFPPSSETRFPILFDAIEEKSNALHIISYGVSNTSLEEVFLQLGEEYVENKPKSTEISINSFRYLNSFAQVSLLVKKRLIVQKRDMKGLFFKIVLPIVLICLVLLVLLIDVPIEGSPIELTPELYNTSGTGASIGNKVLVAGTMFSKKDAFLDLMNGEYPSVDMAIVPLLNSSQDVSDIILDRLQNGEREFNFGSFVFEDTINATFNVDWTESSADGNGGFAQIREFFMGNLTRLIPESNTTSLIDNLNTALINQNVTGSEEFTASLVEMISEGDSVFDLLNETLTFIFGPTDMIENIGDFVNNTDSFSDILNQTLTFFNFTVEDLQDRLFNDADEVVVAGNGWSFVLTEDQLINFLNNNLTTESYNLNVQIPVSVMHNTSSSHSVAVFTQTYYNFLFKQCSSTQNATLLAVNYPLPLTEKQSTDIRAILSIIASILLAIPFNYIPAAFAVFVVKERSCKSKHLQLVSGVDLIAYWASTFIWDMLTYMLLAIMTMVVFLCFGDISAVFSGTVLSFMCTFTIIVGYGFSSLPFAYLLTRFFDNPPNAQISIMIIFFITGFVATNAYFILERIETTRDIAVALRPLFRAWPAYNLGDGFINLAFNYWTTQVYVDAPSPFEWNECGRPIVLLFALAIPYSLWLMLLEYSSDGGSGGLFGRLMRQFRSIAHNLHNKVTGFDVGARNDVDDTDVLDERVAVKEGKSTMIAQKIPIVIEDLCKAYPKGSLIAALFRKICFYLNSGRTDRKPKIAVNNISFRVQNGGNLGLLGVNGAGKTTTMGILTGDVIPTSGEAYVATHDVTGVTNDGVRLARKNIGFCPQADPLLDLMTGRETLAMFGKLRGIPSSHLDNVVSHLLDKLTLSPHADKVTENYSGGNKRKLSLGIALIGNPKVLFIDESSSGMDPATRRKMWDLIAEAGNDRAVILTTHSMEEAEALCNKIAIMINGRIRCLGGVQHLKQKFLGGYTLAVSCRVNATEVDIDETETHIIDNVVRGASLSERHGRYLKFDVPSFQNGKSNLGMLFGMMQQLVESPDSVVISYSVSQCTLEQIFINLVRAEEVHASSL